MTDNEKRIAKTLADTFNVLPDSKKEYLLGFAEGVAAMAGEEKAKSRQYMTDSSEVVCRS